MWRKILPSSDFSSTFCVEIFEVVESVTVDFPFSAFKTGQACEVTLTEGITPWDPLISYV